jgi:hypothetical protein
MLRLDFRSTRRKDSNLLAVTQRSYALAFSHHHFLSMSSTPSDPPTKRRHINSLYHGTVNMHIGTEVESPNSLPMPVAENLKTNGIASQQSVKSLIPPMNRARSNHQRRRGSSSSLKSFSSVTSSMFSRKRKHTTIHSLPTMPTEILALIFNYLGQLNLLNLMLTNSNILESAAAFLYRHPYFASTYRYAQFAHTVSRNPSYASMVRILDLSYFTKDLDEDGELLPQAGWREFTHRHHEMSYIRNRMVSGAVRTFNNISTHPAPSPHLKNFHRTRDLPAGAICRVIAACKNIRFESLHSKSKTKANSSIAR